MANWFIGIPTLPPPLRLMIKRVVDWYGERGLIRKSLPPQKRMMALFQGFSRKCLSFNHRLSDRRYSLTVKS